MMRPPLPRSSNVTLIPDALIEQEVCRLINCMIHKYGYATFDEIFKLLNKDKFFINLIEKMIKNEIPYLKSNVRRIITKLLIEKYQAESNIEYILNRHERKYNSPDLQTDLQYIRFKIKTSADFDDSYLRYQIDKINENTERENENKFEDEILVAIEKSKIDEQQKRQELEAIQLTELNSLKEELNQKFMYDSPDDSDYRDIVKLLYKYHDETGIQLLFSKNELAHLDHQAKSKIILQICSIFEYDMYELTKIFDYFREHLVTIFNLCKDRTALVTYSHLYDKDPEAEFTNGQVENYLVPVAIKGDGNCLWNSISVALFVDYSMMESLRLLTAWTMISSQDFRPYVERQKLHENSFDNLVRSALELQIWGDEIHIMSLSLSLERPIYSYGSIRQLGNYYPSYRAMKMQYETEDLINHYKYIGDIAHEDNIPVMLYYNGQDHYSVVLPTDSTVKPLVPKTQILEPIRKSTKPEPINIEKTMNIIVPSGSRTNVVADDKINESSLNLFVNSTRDKIIDKKLELLSDIVKDDEDSIKNDSEAKCSRDEKHFDSEMKKTIVEEYQQAKRIIVELKFENQNLVKENKLLKKEVGELRQQLKFRDNQIKRTEKDHKVTHL